MNGCSTVGTGFAERRVRSAEWTGVSPVSICIAGDQTVEPTGVPAERPENGAKKEAEVAAAAFRNATGAGGQTGPIRSDTPETWLCTGNCSFARQGGSDGPE